MDFIFLTMKEASLIWIRRVFPAPILIRNETYCPAKKANPAFCAIIEDKLKQIYLQD